MASSGTFDTIFIDGDWVPAKGSDRIEVISPATEAPIASVPAGSRDDVDAAVAAARRAFDEGPWPKAPLEERMACLAKLKTIFERRAEEIAQAITAEMGSPITASRTQQVPIPIMMMEAQLDLAPQIAWTELRQSKTGNGLVTRRPKGVVVAIVPWNAPLMVTLAKIGPALLAGCTVILKPAPESPLSAYLLAEMIQEAGFPPGTFNMLCADRAESEYLALHPGVDKVSFTGSTVAGRTLAKGCGELLRPITLELGGKSAAVLLEDADIGAAIDALRVGSFRNSGQICSLKTRIVVPRAKEAEVLERLEALVASMPVGDPLDEATEIGPMVSQRQRDRVEGYIDLGVKEGARLVCGGTGRPEGLDRGWFVRPTILGGVDPDARVAQEEIFGPVLSVIPYDTEEQAIAVANNSSYGLNGSVFTADTARGVEIAQRIKSGVVEVNGGGCGFHCPIGGVKASGIGREHGREGFDPYVEIRTIGLPKDYADSLA
ncbi:MULTISPECIES: aldehyde dehydrogenase [Salipiger]|jgi:aldehyde dehydrogenase (NAD+)|uniref:Betaine-aldehyde dehydrogenase n=1 Tax=Salipiger profundus TaxID=1229727 RepID=A0A1U7D9Z4_9RHOB|nr:MULTISPECIES: aldehyde dehydrogenase [Salipiger]APX24984.1 betaine-aldehyde dehydrogenase [Salipiger profundus]GFZ99339.1 aldehyde dehydrogenase [Salipiger profundus]SFC93220.1 betaine-aldehyde dehydrogenase [Salipiger profundus]